MNGTVKTGLALAGGYLLGRTKKAKLAIGFGMFLAGRKLPLDPRELGRLVSTSPALAGLGDQVRSELFDATRSAASSALTHRMTGLADSLHERTRSLDGEARDGRQDGDDTQAEARDDTRDEAPAEEQPARRRTPAAKAPSKSGRASTDKARKAAAPAGKRAASAGGARKKAERGGGRG